jgi:hypothetical protein
VTIGSAVERAARPSEPTTMPDANAFAGDARARMGPVRSSRGRRFAQNGRLDPRAFAHLKEAQPWPASCFVSARLPKEMFPMRALSMFVMLSALALGAGCAANSQEDPASAEADLASQERAAVINALRAKVKPELGNQDILFNFSQGSFRTAGNYAFVMGRIQLSDGSEPTTVGTAYEEDAREGLFDGFRIEALLKKQGSSWTVAVYGIGSTDVWYEGVDQDYPDAPKSIFPWHDGQSLQQVAPSERMQIMSGLRAVVKPELNNQDIVFNVSQGRFAVADGYCWLQGQIELRHGGEPTARGTSYEDEDNEGLLDGFHIEALLKKEGDTWKVLEHGIGSTDVWYVGIAGRHPDAPASIFPPGAAETP